MNDIFSNGFALSYEPAPDLLVGRWLREMADRSLLPPQEELLIAALYHNNCRFWLLHMRNQPDFSLLLLDWLSQMLAQPLVLVLGSPVFMACVADERHLAEIESISYRLEMLRQQAEHEFYPYFFHDEDAARAWLADSQDHEHRPPRR